MAPILLYLLKANAALLLFGAAYFGLLRRLTFFTLNRFYLLFALLFAAGYPALPVPALLPAEATPAVAFAVVEAAGSPGVPTVPVAPTVDWATVGVALYAAGTAVLLARLLGQLLALWRLRRQSRPAVVHGLPVRVLAGAVSPFSFGPTIYLNPAQHPAPELAAVLRHEQVHVRQWHTLDVLLTQLALAAAWCNPAAWLLRRALLDNLEYLADHAVLETGLDRRAYQYSLLRLSHAAAGPSLVSHFTFPTLKNRVAMMNTPLSSTGQLARYFVAGPLVLAVALGLAGARAQGAGPVVPAAKTASATVQPVATLAPAAKAEPATAAAPMTAHATTAARMKQQPRKIAGATASPTAAAPAIIRLDGPPSGPPPAYYVDGTLYTQGLNALNPDEIARIEVVKGTEAAQALRQHLGDAATNGVVFITTKANEHRADVVAFNQKMNSPAAPAPVEPVQNVPYLAAPALAYITQHYPDARLLGVTEVPSANGGPANYKAQLAIGRRPVSLLFDERGQFISEVPYTR
ncbi:M56 family metallopeptidase [Hymenobacter terricola]|uniref:M56 family metallopeptidase n=1 Tax=Hymenobacter terricola TaxID=2819236 RepID=UPI001B30D19F|nr:M56 family metallopeptidase [Hymenobacter terricola]